MQIKRNIKYESELDKEFIKEVASMYGGEEVYNCIQCGTCSGTCPISLYMDYTPRRIMAMIRSGFKDEVLKSFTIWLCSSCYSCTVQCPMNIKITDIMYALKRMAIEENICPRKFPIPVLAREFTKMVRNYGRINEGRLTTKLFFKSNPFKIFNYSNLGMKLFKLGRIKLMPETIKNPKEIKTLLKGLEGKK
ncbi:MAG: 4Fe-4S dicluster domain-containing protein [Acidobacteriota bacterium]